MSDTKKLRDLAKVIRSKNAKPYRLTFDIMFEDVETYKRVKESKVITPELFCKLYGIPKDSITFFSEFDPGLAIKITIKRPIVQCDPGETDVFGAQQHVPLMDIEIPWN
jgi:hypothetical protein